MLSAFTDLVIESLASSSSKASTVSVWLPSDQLEVSSSTDQGAALSVPTSVPPRQTSMSCTATSSVATMSRRGCLVFGLATLTETISGGSFT